MILYRKIKTALYLFVKQPFKFLFWRFKTRMLYLQTMLNGECTYGPFTGEFGHLLGHNLPFLAYLYSKGIKVNFCGLEIHKPFFVDEDGNSIVSSYLSIRDFFKEGAPDCNSAKEPTDVNKITASFSEAAKNGRHPYWDNANSEYYFDFFRWWILKNKYNKVFDLSKIYKTKDENAVVIFPRKWNVHFSNQTSAQLKNNGEIWDYFEVSKCASKYFDKVYVIGHPVFCEVNFSSYDNVEVLLIADNSLILEKCSNSKLIISQHSGSVYLGEYTNTPILIIYKGGRSIGDIEITKQFKKGLGSRHEFNYAFSFEEIENHLKQI